MPTDHVARHRRESATPRRLPDSRVLAAGAVVLAVVVLAVVLL